MNDFLVLCVCDWKGVSIKKPTFVQCVMYFLVALAIGLTIGTVIKEQFVKKASIINYGSKSILFNPFELFPEQAPPRIVIGESNYQIEQKKIQEQKEQEEKQRNVIARDRIPTYNDSDVVKLAENIVLQEFDFNEWLAFYELVNRESGWQVGIYNKGGSGACGLGQALPCSKMGDAYGDPEGEIRWTLEYIKGRYGSPSNALLFHSGHNWY